MNIISTLCGSSTLYSTNSETYNSYRILDYNIYAIIAPTDGVFVNFKNHKITINAGEIVFVRRGRICLAHEIKEMLQLEIDELEKQSYCIADRCESNGCDSPKPIY